MVIIYTMVYRNTTNMRISLQRTVTMVIGRVLSTTFLFTENIRLTSTKGTVTTLLLRKIIIQFLMHFIMAKIITMRLFIIL